MFHINADRFGYNRAKKRTATTIQAASGSFRKLDHAILEIIVSHLEDTNLFAPRQTFMYIATATQTPFARQCLHTIRTDFSLYSLERIGFLSQNPNYTSHIQALLVYSAEGHKATGSERWKVVLRRLYQCTNFKIRRNTGGDITRQAPPITFDDALELLLRLISQAGIHVRSFTLDPAPGSGCAIYSLTPIDKRIFNTGEFVRAWRGVEELTISHVEPLAVHARDLTVLAGRFRKLDLSLWLGPSAFSDALFATVFPRLRELALATSAPSAPPLTAHVVERDPLRRFLWRHWGGLRRVELSRIQLKEDSWVPVFRTLRKCQALAEIVFDSLFVTAFGKIVVHFPQVEQNPVVDSLSGGVFEYKTILIGSLYVGGEWNRVVTFVRYKGAMMDVALERVLDCDRVGY
ncbi:hypothetical protein BJX70DRAFT_395149 [Aspergillus crustosus]